MAESFSEDDGDHVIVAVSHDGQRMAVYGPFLGLQAAADAAQARAVLEGGWVCHVCPLKCPQDEV